MINSHSRISLERLVEQDQALKEKIIIATKTQMIKATIITLPNSARSKIRIYVKRDDKANERRTLISRRKLKYVNNTTNNDVRHTRKELVITAIKLF